MAGRQKLRRFLRRTIPAITLLMVACWIIGIQLDAKYYGRDWDIELDGSGIEVWWYDDGPPLWVGCFGGFVGESSCVYAVCHDPFVYFHL